MIVREQDVVFAQADHEDLTADLYFPQNGKKLPVLLLIHGGAWQAGSKEMFMSWGPYLAQAGFFVMSINYRLSSPERSTWPGVFTDVQMALSWLVDNATQQWDIDIDRIGVVGESCGAQLATMLAIENQTRAKIRTIVGVYGIYDVEEWWNYTNVTRNDDPVGNLFGAAPSEQPEAYRRSSPAVRMGEDMPNEFFDTRFFMVWGETDKVVPPSQSENFIQQLERLGIEVEKHAVPEEGHYWFSILPGVDGGTVNDYPNRIVAPKLVRFLEKELLY